MLIWTGRPKRQPQPAGPPDPWALIAAGIVCLALIGWLFAMLREWFK